MDVCGKICGGGVRGRNLKVPCCRKLTVRANWKGKGDRY